MKRDLRPDRLDLSLTEEMIAQAAAIVEAGNFRYVAAQRLGVPFNTWRSWIVRGKKEVRAVEKGERDKIGLQGLLVLELDKAEARCHQRLLSDVVDSENVQAKIWFLERRYNKLYSKNPNARIDDESGEEIKVDAAQILAEKLSQFLED